MAHETVPSHWEPPSELPGYVRTVDAGAVSFRRQLPVMVLAHGLLQVAFLLLAPLLLLSEDRKVVALVSLVVWTCMLAVGSLHVMDEWLRRATAHAPVRRSIRIERGQGSTPAPRLTVDGTTVEAGHLLDVMVVFPTSFGEPERKLSEEDLRQVPADRAVNVPGMPGRMGTSWATATFRLTLLTTARAHDVASLVDADTALSTARAWKRALGLPAEGPVRVAALMPFSARTRMLWPFIWLFPEALAPVALGVLVSQSEVTLRTGALLIVLGSVFHNLCMVGLGLSQRKDARDTGEGVLFTLSRQVLGRRWRRPGPVELVAEEP